MFSKQLAEAMRQKKRGEFVIQVRTEGHDWIEIDTKSKLSAAAHSAAYQARSVIDGHFFELKNGSSRWGAGNEFDKAHKHLGLGKNDDNFLDVEWRVLGPDGKVVDTGWRNASVPEDYMTNKTAQMSSRQQGKGRYRGPKFKLKPR